MVCRVVVPSIASAIAGTILAHAMFALPLLTLSTTIRGGGGPVLAEAVATFGLVTLVMAGARSRHEFVAWRVGLYITAAYWFTASTSFANPALTIARSLTDSFSGIRPLDAPAFIVAQLAGGLAAALLASWLFRAMPEQAYRPSSS